ncbi:MAG: hypothetical protein R3259_09385 [Salinimicrobium sediminis]|nr:hypothetical protein [Salinimicrobium sediminis]
MKKIYLLCVAVILAACSAEPVENEFSGLDLDLSGKSNNNATVQDVGESFDVPDLICAGEEATFTFNFSDKPGNTNLKVQLFGDDPDTEEVEEWYNIFNEQFGGGGPENFNYTFEEAGEYLVRYQIGGGGFTELSVAVVNCGCEESFTYVDNGDMTYTFTYVPEENMTGANLVFTFAQSVEVTGLEDWTNSGNGAISSTERKIMDLEACEIYNWTVTLEKDCSGNSGSSNVWTDFKVNGNSKKTEFTPNITQNCN